MSRDSSFLAPVVLNRVCCTDVKMNVADYPGQNALSRYQVGRYLVLTIARHECVDLRAFLSSALFPTSYHCILLLYEVRLESSQLVELQCAEVEHGYSFYLVATDRLGLLPEELLLDWCRG